MSNYPQYNLDEKPSSSSKIPLITLGARVVTLATLLVSWGVLQTSEVTFDNGARLTYDYYRSYRYIPPLVTMTVLKFKYFIERWVEFFSNNLTI